jgi:hypothetical protein
MQRKIQQTQYLAVNTSHAHPRFVTNKTRNEGILDIGHLVDNESYEESWAFIPPNTWIETGDIHNNNEKMLSVKSDKEFIGNMLKEHNYVEFWHFHPNNAAYEVNKVSKIDMNFARAVIKIANSKNSRATFFVVTPKYIIQYNGSDVLYSVPRVYSSEDSLRME